MRQLTGTPCISRRSTLAGAPWSEPTEEEDKEQRGCGGPRWQPEALPESKLAVECLEPEPDDPGLSLPGLCKW